MADDALSDWLEDDMKQKALNEPSTFQVVAPPAVAVQIRRLVHESMSDETLASFQDLRIESTDVTEQHGREATASIRISGLFDGDRIDQTVTSKGRQGRYGHVTGSIAEFAQQAAIQDTAAALRRVTGTTHPFDNTARKYRSACRWVSGAATILPIGILSWSASQNTPSHGLGFFILSSVLVGGGLLLALLMIEPLIAPSNWLLTPGIGRRWFVRAGIPHGNSVGLLRSIASVIALAGFALFAFGLFLAVTK